MYIGRRSQTDVCHYAAWGVLWVLLLGPLLSGCDDDFFDNDIAFSVSCDTVDCGNADSADIFTDAEPQRVVCQWDCIDFQDGNDDFIILTFERRRGECWRRISVFRADGLCR